MSPVKTLAFALFAWHNTLFATVDQGVIFACHFRISLTPISHLILNTSSIFLLSCRVLNNGKGFDGAKLMELARYTLTEYSVLNTENLVHIVICAVIMTIIRYILDFLLFKVSTCVDM